MRKFLPGTITIARIDTDQSKIRIRLIDAASSSPVVDIEIAPEQFSMALTGASYQDVKFELLSPELAGKVLETKHEVIFMPKDGVSEFLAQYEVDGWIADLPSALNHHNWAGSITAYGMPTKVLFRRYVVR